MIVWRIWDVMRRDQAIRQHESVPRGTLEHAHAEVETVLSMLTTVFASKKMGHRVWAYFRARADDGSL
jgi:hypothetical protein